MEIIFVLLAISISLAIFFLISFLWASSSGQFDDAHGPAMRILFEDEDETMNSDKPKKKEECK